MAEVRLERTGNAAPIAIGRRPTFCAGCPHNISTSIPDGSYGMTGIGCHGMAMFMPDRNPLPLSHMGGEGAAWLGMAPFTTTNHIFQNLGDGTYQHSGSLAIRAAVAAKVNITFKILYNHAVAMTGGQPVEGSLTVGRIASQALAEGVASVVVVSDQPERVRVNGDMPATVKIRHRDKLAAVQQMLRETPGVTVLIYDQMCAAEKRRKRKRGEHPDPDRRIFINHLVCEGCGDCSVQSNCIAIQPLETELGRKRVIDQSSCNKDYSCVKGFCPSFVTIEGARTKPPRAVSSPAGPLPEPHIPELLLDYNILVTGIGGTGVVTIGAIIGMAAHLQGVGASVYDMTGLSQKGGSVFSHVRLWPRASAYGPPAKIAAGEADLIIACDIVAATQTEATQSISKAHTAVIVNRNVTATADFSRDPDLELDFDQLASIVRAASSDGVILTAPAETLARQFFGDSIAVNMIMLGFAWQSGKIPLSRAAIKRAIELNGVAVTRNLDAFRIGRLLATRSRDHLLALANGGAEGEAETSAKNIDEFVSRRIEDLNAYWSRAYAQIYAVLMRKVLDKDEELGRQSREFSWAVARSAFKVMAYKDEYEVARLYTDGRFDAALSRQFESGYKLSVHLAPPILSRWVAGAGRPGKMTFGPWVFMLLRLLARLKFLRETWFDIFGITAERRLERRLRDEYLSLIRGLCHEISRDKYESGVALAKEPQLVRGFGVVKLDAMKELLARMGDKRRSWQS